jgi:membrane protein required for colicin V production
MGQDIFDLIIVLTLGLFTLRGFFNGFVGEIAGLVSLLGGFWAAHTYHAELAEHLTMIQEPVWSTIVAYVGIFLAVIIVVTLLARLLQKILSCTFVAWVDGAAGGLLGLAKGILLCSLILLLLQKFFANAEFIQNSRVLPYFNQLITQIRSWMPPDMLERFGI